MPRRLAHGQCDVNLLTECHAIYHSIIISRPCEDMMSSAAPAKNTTDLFMYLYFVYKFIFIFMFYLYKYLYLLCVYICIYINVYIYFHFRLYLYPYLYFYFYFSGKSQYADFRVTICEA